MRPAFPSSAGALPANPEPAAGAAPERPALGVLADPESVEHLRLRFLELARSRYRIGPSDAEDVVQTAFAAYLQFHPRYPAEADHRAILYGIFRKKCLAYIDRSVREQRRLERYCATPDAARENPWIRPERPAQTASVLEDLVRRETRHGILESILQLRPSSRELVSMILTRELRRKDLIERLALNKNTFDSRMHQCRAELRALLRRRDLGEWRSPACAEATRTRRPRAPRPARSAEPAPAAGREAAAS